MKIWAHTLVKNEERFLWYAVTSVIDHVDKVLLWDTGSTDKTPLIIRALKREHTKKIETNFLGSVSASQFTKIRQEMLDRTQADWFMILDGDEVWWDEKISSHVDFINKNRDYKLLASGYINLVGDVYHYQPENAGKYTIAGKTGHISIRFMSLSIPGLHFSKPHGQQGIYDKNGQLIQDVNKYKTKVFSSSYMHFTNLVRSADRSKDLLVPKRDFKLKYELGKQLDVDYYYPEVFFSLRPDIVSSPWVKMDKVFYTKSVVQTPLKKAKRKMSILKKTGY